MGIFGAMTTAVSGLRAQAYALENISGNIANSQTTGFKRVETSFVDLLPDMPYRKELAGSVSAFSRLTNTIQGDLQSTGVSTNMAVNGEGFFIVQERTGYQNNVPTFGGVDLYTRRGDFTLDKDGFLVNGAGLYLRGTSIDPITGDTINSGNGVVRISSEPLGARQTTQIVYRANLPTRPGTTNAVPEVAGSELLAAPPGAPPPPAPAFPAGYDPRITTVPAPAGAGVVVGSDVNRFMAQSIEGGLIPAYNAVGARIDIQMRWAKVLGSAVAATTTAGNIGGGIPLGGGGGNLVINGTTIAIADGDTSALVVSKINAQTAATNVTASLNGSNQLVLTHASQGGGGNLVVNGTTIALADGDSSATLLAKINAQTGTTNVTASLNGSNQLVLTHANQGGGGNLVVNGTTIALADSDSSATVLSKINAQSATTGVSASLNGSNQLVLTHANQGGGGNLVVNGTTIALADGDSSATIVAKINAQNASTNVTASLDPVTSELILTHDTAGNVDVDVASDVATLTELGLTTGSFATSTQGSQDISGGLTSAGNVIVGGASAAVTLTELGLTAGTTSGATTGTQDVSAGLSAPGSVIIGAGSAAATLTELGLAAGTTSGVNTGTQNVSSGLSAAGNVVIGPTSSAATLTELGLSSGTTSGAVTGTQDISAGLTAGDAGNVVINGTTIILAEGDSSTAILNKINAANSTTGVSASIVGGNLVLTSNDITTDIDIGASSTAATLAVLGLSVGTTAPTPTAGETWNLFYLTNSRAANNMPAWQNVGVPFVFNTSGQMVPLAGDVVVNGLTVDGNNVGDISFDFGNGGLTQYASADGRVQQSTLQQDGYSSGVLDSVSVTSDGRISGSYTNGRVVTVAAISIAQFNADNALKRRDGGVYEQTLESGLPIIGLNGSTIIGGNVEGSNTDIAEEFSKMIVTQQAYSANTRVVSTSQQMLSDVLNMVR